MSTDTERRELVRPGATIAYWVSGPEKAPVVVLLHGLAGSSRELLRTARALQDHRVLLVDQRGHGASTRLPDDLSRDAFVGDVVAAIEELDEHIPYTL